MAEVVKQQQGKNTKKQGKKWKKKPKTMTASIPLVLHRGFSDSNTVDAIGSMVEYEMHATTAFDVLLKEVSLDGTAAKYSYDLSMLIPGYGHDTGSTLCDLRATTIKITSRSPTRLFFRLQRPMGFREDASAVAMWEPLGKGMVHEMTMGQSLTLHSSNNSTSHMVPREHVHNGDRYVHLFSFAATRDEDTASGSLANEDHQVAFHIEVATKYKSLNGVTGERKMYYVERFSGSERLNHVNVGPLATMSIADIRCKGGQVYVVTFVNDSGNHPSYVKFVDSKGIYHDDSDLDKKTKFRLPVGVICEDSQGDHICGVIAYKADESRWCLCRLTYNTSTHMCDSTWGRAKSLEAFFASEQIHPIGLCGKKLSLRNNVGFVRRGIYLTHPSRVYNSLMDDGIADYLLNAVVIVAKVSKIALELLTVVGALSDPVERTIGPQVVGSESNI